MDAVILESAGQARFTQVEGPSAPGPGEALVEVRRVGVCGTDLHAFAGKQPMIAFPLILGHELAVEVVEVGAGVDEVPSPGQTCTVVPYLNCGSCGACVSGRTNACVELRVLGVHLDGGMTRRINVPARLLVPTPDLPLDAVALVEMLAVGEHAVHRSQASEADRVLVIGAGPIGLGAAKAAQRRTEAVALHDLSEDRLRFAVDQRLGEPVPGGGDDPEDLASRVRSVFGGQLPSVVVDATGSVASMVTAPSLLAPGGRLALVGHTPHALPFDNQTLHRRELTVLACRNATKRDFDAVVQDLDGDGGASVLRWISHRVPLEEVPAALFEWTGRPSGLVKAVVED